MLPDRCTSYECYLQQYHHQHHLGHLLTVITENEYFHINGGVARIFNLVLPDFSNDCMRICFEMGRSLVQKSLGYYNVTFEKNKQYLKKKTDSHFNSLCRINIPFTVCLRLLKL